MNEKLKETLSNNSKVINRVYTHDSPYRSFFWSGHISNLIHTLNSAPMCSAYEVLDLLNFCKDQYDKIIIDDNHTKVTQPIKIKRNENKPHLIK